MVIGDKNEFAIETEMFKAYESLGFLAGGFFVIYINGFCYGVRELDATMLACSYNEVKFRLSKRGTHTFPFLSKLSTKAIVWAHLNACWRYPGPKKILGFEPDDLLNYFAKKEISWAPDGDEAFDDGSKVLQFDDENYVRLIGYQYLNSKRKLFGTVNEIILSSDRYYNVLSQWVETFDEIWKNMPKSSPDEPW